MAGKKWEEQELLILQENYDSKTQKDFMELLPSRSYKSIECMANRLGLSKPSRAWTEEELNILKENYPVSTPQEILSLLPDRTNQTITHMANKLGIFREDYRWTEEEDNMLKQYYDNKTIKDLMLLFPNRTNNGIKLRARKLGLWQDVSLPYRKYSYDYSFFSLPDVNNSYYAGFIAADGSVSEKMSLLRINIKENDGYILERFKHDLGYTGELSYFRDYPGNNSVIKNKSKFSFMVAITLCGAKQIVEDLRNNYNIIPNKTLILQPPTRLDWTNSYSFIVGLIDGDGSIGLNKHNPSKWGTNYSLSISLAGTFEMLFWVKCLFDQISSNKNRHNAEVTKQKTSNIWVYRVGGNRAYQILKELQKVPTPTRLARKWNKIAEYEQLVGIQT